MISGYMVTVTLEYVENWNIIRNKSFLNIFIFYWKYENTHGRCQTHIMNIIKYILKSFIFLFWEWKLLNNSMGKTIFSLLEIDFYFSNQEKEI